jgi:hypothetical protein
VAISNSSGITPVTAGGTGLASYTSGDLIYVSSADGSVMSKLGIGASDSVLTSDGSAPAYVAGTTYMDTISGMTTRGDVVYRGASNSTRLAVGTTGQVLTSNGTDPTWSAAPAADEASVLQNVGFKTSVGSNILTVSLQQADGATDPTAGSPSKISFRSSTATNGGYDIRTVSSIVSVSASSGSTLGLISGNTEDVYVYAIDNAGTVELALSANRYFDGGALQSPTAEGGAGGADSRSTLYSLTARTNVGVRLIGKIEFSLTTAGTWDEAGDRLSVITSEPKENHASTYQSGGATVDSIRSTCSGSSSIGRQTGFAASIANYASGGCAITFESGYYVNTPTCVVTPETAGVMMRISGTSTSSVTYACKNADGTTDCTTGYSASLVCVGAK